MVSARDSSTATKTDDDSTETDESTKSVKTTTAEKSIIVVTIAVEALTTTFTPPAICTGHLSQMSAPGYALWLNEPQPVEGIQVSECYPSQFMKRYTSLVNESSSIAPLMSPLVCPKGWKTAKVWENGYIACCASGYNLAPPTVTSDTDRPAYGGTCYSPFTVGQTATVTAYDSENITATADWVASSSADQAYAHVIDGFALDLLVTTSTTASTSLETTSGAPSDTPSASASAAASSSKGSSKLSGGAIAGIVIGCLAVVGIALGVLFWLFRRRRSAPTEKHLGELDGDPHQEFEVHGSPADSALASSLTATEGRYYTGSVPPSEMVSNEVDTIGRPSDAVMSPLSAEVIAARNGRLQRAELDSGWKGY
ncbi:hypothetical protein B0J13DRAFT_624510 [Dactylonectria estremocensis]|uniref:Uncharacterized protein n=1 Tax=Dactylonectria estremocensis TaxID=1079267 RepID=A0A9P9EM93_9HYPO|nr:hypothetical protein B0J13DRAFT_624510 [Dactylonectria estremocensis]